MDEIKWIDVKKRLPEKDGEYVVYTIGNDGYMDIKYAEFYHDLANPITGYSPKDSAYFKDAVFRKFSEGTATNVWVECEYSSVYLITDITDSVHYWMPIESLFNAPVEE